MKWILLLLIAIPSLNIAEPVRLERVEAVITGYSSSSEETDSTPFLTANQERVHWGGVACPSRYPFGTYVQIAGEEFLCNDRMNLRYRNQERFDIWFPSKEEARKFGSQKQIIYANFGEKI